MRSNKKKIFAGLVFLAVNFFMCVYILKAYVQMFLPAKLFTVSEFRQGVVQNKILWEMSGSMSIVIFS